MNPSQPIASDLSYEILQARRLRGELGAQSCDTNHRLCHIPSMLANRRKFIADVDEFTDQANPHASGPITVPQQTLPLGNRHRQG